MQRAVQGRHRCPKAQVPAAWKVGMKEAVAAAAGTSSWQLCTLTRRAFALCDCLCRGLEYIDKAGVKHQPVASWSFVAADGVEMPLEEGTSCFM